MTKGPIAGVQRPYRRSVLTWLHLVRVYNRVSHIEQTLLSEFGLTPAQFDVLSHLATEPGLNQQMLADRLLVSKGNVCGLIDRLERDGYVERRRDPQDRRSYQLHLCDAGWQAFEAAAPALEAELARQFERLPADEMETLMRLLARLDRELRREGQDVR